MGYKKGYNIYLGHFFIVTSDNPNSSYIKEDFEKAGYICHDYSSVAKELPKDYLPRYDSTAKKKFVVRSQHNIAAKKIKEILNTTGAIIKLYFSDECFYVCESNEEVKNVNRIYGKFGD